MHHPRAHTFKHLKPAKYVLSITYLIHVHLLYPLQRGFTALHLASQNGHRNVVTILLESGSDIHAVNEVCALHITTFNCTPTSSVLKKNPIKGTFPFCFWAYFTVCLHHAVRPVCFPLICYHIVLNFEEHIFRVFQRMYCNYDVYACEILLCACLHAHILHELQILCHKMFTESNPHKFCLVKIWCYMVCPSYIPPRRKQWPHYT